MMQFLSNLKLSVTQWLLATLAALVGILVVALRLQGRRLHKAQVDLLDARTDVKVVGAERVTREAVDKYYDALSDFFKAGGKL